MSNQTIRTINDLTVAGKNICSTCNRAKVMYYRPFCPTCDSVTITTVKEINLFEMAYAIERIKDIARYKNRIIEYFIDSGYITGNDSSFNYNIVDDVGSEEILNEVNAFLLKQGFKGGDRILFWVSW